MDLRKPAEAAAEPLAIVALGDSTAREEAVTLVDVHRAFEDCDDAAGRSIRELLLEDGIHPSDGGQRLVCVLLTDAIAGILGS